MILLISTSILFLFFLISARTTKSIFAPDTYFLAVQFAFFLCCLIFVPHYQYYEGGLAFAVGCALLWLVGSLMVMVFPRNKGVVRPVVNVRTSNKVILALCMPALAIFVQKILDGGSIGMSMAEIARSNASARYGGYGGQTLVENIFVSFAFVSCILGGKEVLARRGLQRIYALLPIFTMFIVAAVQDTKASIIYALCLFLAGLFVRQLTGTALRFSLKVTAYSALGVVIMAQVFGAMQNIRYNGALGRSATVEILEVYAFGGLSGFTIWDAAPTRVFEELGGGAHSLGAVHERLSEQSVRTGNDHIPISDRYTTTITTLLGVLVHDFGHVAVAGIAFFSGMVAGIVRLQTRQGSAFVATLAISIYALATFSPFTSLFNYTSIVLALVIYCVIHFLQCKTLIMINKRARWRRYE